MKRFRLINILLVILVLLVTTGVFVTKGDTEDETGNWRVDVDKDPLTDTEKVYLSLPCNEDLGYSLFGMDKILVLTGDQELYVVWDEYLGGNNTISYRFDYGEVTTKEWILSKDGTALFCPNPEYKFENFCDFVSKLLSHDRLVVGLTPYGGSRETAVFNLKGLSAAMRPHRITILLFCL